MLTSECSASRRDQPVRAQLHEEREEGIVEGIARDQVTLFPDRVEDWIDEDHPVRVIDTFVDAMDLAEALEGSEAKLRNVTRLKEKLARVRQEVRRLEGIAEALKDVPDGQVSLTDADARSMATYGKETGLVDYNL